MIPHIACQLHVTGDKELAKEVAFWVEATNIQLREHFTPAWGDYIGKPPAVFLYDTAVGIPAAAAAVMGIFRDAGNDEAAGYHAAIGKLVIGAVDLSRSRHPSRTLSHEGCEIGGNPWLDEWVQSPTEGRLFAREVSDPVQRNGYTIKARILGETREVYVGDFVTPEWFGLKGPNKGRLSYLGIPRKPFEVAPGGYQVALENDTIIYLPARGEAIRANAITRPLSRTVQITNRVTIPHKEEATP